MALHAMNWTFIQKPINSKFVLHKINLSLELHEVDYSILIVLIIMDSTSKNLVREA